MLLRLNHFLLILSWVVLSACVGTLEDVGLEVNPGETYKTSNVEFAGIEDAFAVAHNRVILVFSPASGGTEAISLLTERFSYLAYKNGNAAMPVASVTASSIFLGADGKIYMEVGGLTIGTSYVFSVKAMDKTSGIVDTNTVEKVVTTLDYEVPIFDGITDLQPSPGVDGQSQLVASWNAAEPSSNSGGFFGGNPNEISGYNIYLGTDSNNLTFYGSINDGDATEFTLTGLQSGTAYYVMVRAKNSESPSKEDKNIWYKKATTDVPQSISFAGLTSATIPSSIDGFSKINLSWSSGVGNFDRYKVFISTTPVAAFDPLTDSPHTSSITDLSTTSATINVAAPHTIYYIAVVACENEACVSNKGADVVKTAKTSPPVAPFNGIKNITQPEGFDGLTSLDVSWDAPDTNYGVYDTIKIFLTDMAGNYDEVSDRLPIFNAGTPTVPGYDLALTTLTSTRIKGLQTNTNYCFIIKAYSTSPIDPESPNGRTHINEKKVCGVPVLTLPGFTGVNSICNDTTSTGFTIEWNTPDPTGLYDYYEIFYKRDDGTFFSFDDAIAGNPDYTRLVSSPSSNQYTFTTLFPSTFYKIGMRTYFKHPVTEDIYRDGNQMVATCTTGPVKVEHNGFFEIQALGRKIHGLTGAVIREHFTDEGVDGVYKHRYPQEYPTGTASVDSSDNGMVRIAWNDFSLTGGLGRMYDYLAEGNGYNVYRKPYEAAHEIIPPALNDSDWGMPLNSTPIVPKKFNYAVGEFLYYVEFNDYTVAAPASGTESKIYWYKVETVMNGVRLEYDTVPADAILKVVVPPDNMAYVPRWAVNKEICELMQLIPDRSNHHRCVYNGLGTNNGYYDIAHDMLVDRFELGTKFSRGDSIYRCTDISMGADFEGTGDNGTIEGDCIGRGDNPNGRISALRDSIYLDRFGQFLYINRSAEEGTTWRRFDEYSAFHSPSVDDSQTPIPNFSVTQYPSGEGLGQYFSSNAAKLPVIKQFHPKMFNWTCKSYEIIHKGTTLLKRLPRRIEQIGYAGEHYWYMGDYTQMGNIEKGVSQNGAPLSRDCNASEDSAARPGIYDLDLTSEQYAGLGNGYTIQSSGWPSGSAGAHSDEACTTAYGLQSVYGNWGEFTGDELYCHPAWGCSVKWMDEGETTELDTEVDPEGMEYWKNGDGSYFNMKYVDSIGQMIIPADWDIYLMQTPVLRYLSVPLGMGLSCDGTACGGGTDENTRITALADDGAFPESTEIFQFFGSANTLYNTLQFVPSVETCSPTTGCRTFISLPIGHYYGRGSSRFAHQSRYGTVWITGARCMTPIDEGE